MGHARMVGILRELLFQRRSRLQVGGVALVGLRLGAGDVQGREDLRLVVFGVAGGQRFEGLGTRQLARPLGLVGKVGVVTCDGLDVVALALRLGAHPPPLLDRRHGHLRGLRRSALSRQRVVHLDRRDTESGDAARRIVLQDMAERLLSGGEPERVQHCHRALQFVLHLGVAAVREDHLAELAFALLRLVPQRRAGENEGQCDGSRNWRDAHGLSPRASAVRRARRAP
jgi:hypothetical protein